MNTLHKEIDYTYPAGAIKDGTPTVKAYISVAPGLIVTPAEPIRNPTPKPQAKAWVVTHTHTGLTPMRAGTVLTRKTAFLIAGILGGIYLWDSLKDTNGIGRVAEHIRAAGLWNWLRNEVGQ